MDRLDSNGLPGTVLAHPLFLVVVDADTRRFSLEGRVSDVTPWDNESKRIQRNRRDVQCLHVDEDGMKQTVERLRSDHFDQWPSRSIVDPPDDPNMTSTHTVGARARFRGGASQTTGH